MSVEAGSGGGVDLGEIRVGMTVVDRDGEPLGEVVRVHSAEPDAPPPGPVEDAVPAPPPGPVGPGQTPAGEPVPAQPGAGQPGPVQPQRAGDAPSGAGFVQIDGPVGAVYAAAGQVESVTDDVVRLGVSRGELRDYLFPPAD
ncbi:hypothetical protein [Georgenia wangjunii]|uniref:hypothetical protein n=1 Tax=Georgenia wangjunii TaxID=3117730 RepID=UPI002F26206B